jgi:hypothetical protein
LFPFFYIIADYTYGYNHNFIIILRPFLQKNKKQNVYARTMAKGYQILKGNLTALILAIMPKASLNSLAKEREDFVSEKFAKFFFN